MSAMNKPTVHGDFESKTTRNEDSLLKRAENKMSLFKEQYDNFTENEPIIMKANELLATYGSYKNVPENELDFNKSGFDDARLLAFIKIIEEK